jgi:protein SCO1/2
MKLVVFALALLVGTAHAEPPRPAILQRVGLDTRAGNQVPVDLWFSSTEGRRIQLAELFDGERPVLLVLTYVRCKMLCSLVLRGTIDVVRAMKPELGRDYRVVMVSIDPSEDLASAAARKRDIDGELERGDGWSYLVGAEHSIQALARSLGFRYALDPKTDQFAHPAVIFVLTPTGTISTWIPGTQFDPRQVTTALAIAKLGGVATPNTESILSCFMFDPALRAHRELIEGYLKIGGASVFALLLCFIGGLILWERKRA